MSLHTIEPGLLLAAPRLGDPNFEGTVVLLGVHEDGGSIGWTLARLGVGTSAMSKTSRGELDAEGKDDESWQRDRRVDIALD